MHGKAARNRLGKNPAKVENKLQDGEANTNTYEDPKQADPTKYSAETAIDTLAQIKRHRLYKKHRARQSKKHDKFDWSGLGVNVLTVVLTGLAAGAAIWLALITRTMAIDSDRTARNARTDTLASLIRQDNSAMQSNAYNAATLARADAANRSAGAAAAIQEGLTRSSNQINRDAFSQVQRAFITVLPITAVSKPGADVDTYWVFSTLISNSGNTPTKEMAYSQDSPCAPAINTGSGHITVTGTLINPTSHCSLYKNADGTVVPPADPTDPALLFNNKSDVSRFTLGPHGANLQIGSVAMKQSEIERRANTDKPWFIEGAIQYKDIFEGSEPHVTKYCVVVFMWTGTDGGYRPFLSPCAKWNCTDKECEAT